MAMLSPDAFAGHTPMMPQYLRHARQGFTVKAIPQATP